MGNNYFKYPFPNLLVINRFNSHCGDCGANAFTDDLTCDTCGVVYENLATDYIGMGLAKRIQEMRPDLKFQDIWGEFNGQ